MSARSPLAAFWSDFAENRIALAALAIVLLVVAAAVLAPWITPQDPYDLANLSLMDARRPPGYVGSNGYVHVLGTDAQGRDLYSAIVYGLRISLQMGLAAGACALVIGATLGIVAAYRGGAVETVIMRLVDLQLSFPAILLALVLVAILGQGKGQLIVALVAAQYAYFARTAYGAASAERRKDYVEAAAATPLSGGRIVFRHILPNCLPPLIVVVTVQVAHAIALEATLSFLGIGLPITIVLGTVAAMVLLPDLLFAEALVLGVLLAPTDAALGQAVVTDERVPEELREGLSVESGLNDGVCVPLLFAAIALAELEDAPTFDGGILTDLVTEVGIAVLVGTAAAVVVAWLMQAADRRRWMDHQWSRIVPAAVAVLAYTATDIAGGSGFIGAFVAGIVWAARVGASTEESMDLVEEVGALLSAATFVLFAAVLVGPVIRDIDLEVFAYAVLSLTVVRMGPVALAMLGTRSPWPTVGFAGWFGPRGLASIVFALVVVEESGLPGTSLIVEAATLTVALSVLAHGVSAPMLTARYAAWLGRSTG